MVTIITYLSLVTFMHCYVASINELMQALPYYKDMRVYTHTYILIHHELHASGPGLPVKWVLFSCEQARQAICAKLHPYCKYI